MNKRIESINGSALIRGGKLRHWSNLIPAWHEAIELFCKLIEEDPPYWYNERANLSILSGAAWKTGRVTLEEFGHEKSEKRRGVADSKSWRGRCDIWLADKKEEELIEAKFKWVSLRSTDFGGQVMKAVDWAVADARCSRQVRGARSVGLAFVPVYVGVRYEDRLNELIAKNIEVAKSLRADCVAWCFPASTRYLKGSTEKNLCPGIFLVARCS